MEVPISAVFLEVYTGGSKTPDSFWNSKTSVPTKRRICTDHHHVHWCLEFSWGRALVSATLNAAVELFNKTELVTATQHDFHQQFQRCEAPSRNTLLLWVLQWGQEGSV
jgi:hypothetical protein